MIICAWIRMQIEISTRCKKKKEKKATLTSDSASIRYPLTSLPFQIWWKANGGSTPDGSLQGQLRLDHPIEVILIWWTLYVFSAHLVDSPDGPSSSNSGKRVEVLIIFEKSSLISLQ